MSKTASCAIVACVVAGCGREVAPPPTLTATSGTVKIDGEPAPGVSVLFTPTAGTAGDGAWGITDSQGTFVLTHKSQAEGVPAGTYVVHFSRYVLPNGTPSPPNVSPLETGAREGLPPQWSDRSKSSPLNTVTIAAGSAKPLEFNISLK